MVSADTAVTFQVDMSNAPFDPTTQTVAARGTFNGWGLFALTNNPAGANPYVWSGTTSITNSGVLQYKYTIEPGATYETVVLGGAHNRLAMIPQDGGSLELPKVYYGDNPAEQVTVSVKFQVDLAQQINVGAFDPASSIVYVRGFFNGWGGSDNLMTNDPSILTTNSNGLVSSNVYTTSYDIGGSPGQTTDFKYYIDPGAIWESPGTAVGDPQDNNNRFFNLAQSGPQVLAPVYFSEAPYAPVVTNNVTFQVDMTAQVLNGNFDPSSGTVEVRGNFNSWGTGANFCTNDLSAANTNLYTAVIKIVDGINALEQYKFAATVPVNSGWETMADNRVFNLANTNSQTLPVVFFSNVSPSDLLPADTLVTFRVDMTGAKTASGNPFDPATQQVVINGPPASSFAPWDATALPQLTNNPVGSGTYSVDILIPKYSPLRQTYKYGINDGSNAIDNEAASGNNHVRYIRSTGSYVMPLDTFGNMFSEPAFGNLQSSLSSPDHVLISWLGGPGVHLQSRASLSSGSWLDHPETDGLSSTNWPISGESLFFRLSKP